MIEFIDAPSPNFNARTRTPDAVILHYTGMESGEAALARLRDEAAEVSSHYMVEEDGRIFRLVPEERRAWHAGASFWQGERDMNSASVGIEIVNPGHEFGYRPFTEPQIAAVIALVGDIRTRWQIDQDKIIAHSDVAPARRQDPGELFPWKRLAEAGHGLWVEPPASPGAPLTVGDEGAGVFAMQAGFTRLGFNCPPTGTYDEGTKTIVAAFQRHWLQTRVDGVACGDTRARLVHLLRAAAAG